MSRCVHRVRCRGGRDQSARMEVLEHRRLLAGEIPRLVGISGNQQDPAFLDETLYDIYYDMPGTRDPRFLDGFADVANPPDTVLSVSNPLGATHGYSALRVDVPQRTNAFWGFSSPNVVDLLKAGATTLAYDLTLTNIELNGGSFGGGTDNSFNGFAQNNELAVVINAPEGGFIQRNFVTGGATDSLNTGATWSGVDGTRTITWDLTKFTSGGLSLADFITANNATDARFWFVTQGGDTNGETGPMRFYFDNFVLHNPTTSTLVGDFELVDVEPIVTLPFVPDTDAIGFNPETGLLHRTSGASAYRDDPARVGYNDNHTMQTIDLFSPALTQAGVFNANPQGDGTNGPYGVPAPRPNWLMPAQRRTDDQIAPSFRQQGPDEYHAARDLTWSHSEHLFYVADENGIFKLTADGQSTFVGAPVGIDGDPKGITFFTVEGQRRLLISERDGSLLWTIDPATGQTTANVVPLMDADFNAIPGVLSLVEHPDGEMLMGIGRSLQEPNNAFMRDLIIINPVTGLTTRLGSFGVHMADLAFVYLPGDTDFDADVDADDYFDIDRGDAMDLTGYENGDFNYSGQAGDADDYMLIDRAFLRQQASAPPGGGPLGAAPAPSAVAPPPFLVTPASGDEDEGGLFGDAAALLS